MSKLDFYDWLMTEKNLSHFAAKDVISRCNRVRRIIGKDDLTCDAIEDLNSSQEFANKSKYVKSQLRRAVTLFTEYNGG